MSISKYKFVSPGVFVNEIDNSQLPAATPAIGPVIIGRTERGPSMRPVSINSFSDYVELFGDTVAGGRGGDVWREGNFTSPMYATYAAQAWLRNGQTATVVRLLGAEHGARTSAGRAGWGEYTRASDTGGGSYGLFLIDSGSYVAGTTVYANEVTGTLAAVWYFPTAGGGIVLSGTIRAGGALGPPGGQASGSAILIGNTTAGPVFTAIVKPASGDAKKISFDFTPSSDKYIRKVFNTNPVLTNTTLTAAGNQEKYWLGHSFERSVADNIVSSSANTVYGMILGLGNATNYSNDFSAFKMNSKAAKSGWIISQDFRPTGSAFDALNTDYITKLFQFHSLDLGEWSNRSIKISLTDIKASPNEDVNPYGTFSVQIRRADDTDNVVQIIEQYNNCNLNPNSANYIARKIGDTYYSWDDTEKRFRSYGDYVNVSKFVRVEMNNEVGLGATEARFLPFGFHGPPKPLDFRIHSPADTDLGSAATATDAIDTTGLLADRYNDASFTILIPTVAGGLGGTAITFLLDASESTSGTGGANQIMIGTDDGITDKTRAELIISAINGVTNPYINYATSGNGEASDDLGITASSGSTDTQITLTMDTVGDVGNIASSWLEQILSEVDIIDETAFTGGVNRSEGGSFEFASFATSSLLIDANQAHLSGGLWIGSTDLATSSFKYPQIALRGDSTDAFLTNDRQAYFGYDSRRNGSQLYESSNNDILLVLPGDVSPGTEAKVSVAFTLDDIFVTGSRATYVSGSRQNTTGPDLVLTQSATAASGNYTSILDHKFNKFTVPMYGGFNGWDITQSDPVANINLDSTEKANYAVNTVRRAISTCADPENIDFNLMVAPGITKNAITDLMVDVCEERGDALAIIDLPDVYTGQQEGTTGNFQSRLGNVKTTVSNFKTRRKNSSYAATYYPWVQVRDTFGGAAVWVPPSVVALGTLAFSDRVGELWFAPAGFNRGGLTQGSSGLTVTNVSEKLTSEQRDDLYEVNINPIASFPNEGIVIFGQKTLDATTSALSRINVRRLLIFLKKEVSRLATQVLFDQNVQTTWGRFKGLVIPLLESVKIRFGLTDYKLVLDETTTTPDLIDRNIMYAKIFLKPARAIEFIALDFIITRTGASFED